VNIYVLVKRVPDTESKIRIDHEKNVIIEEGLNFILSPYDEYGVEEALRIKEAQGGKVTVISAGTDATNMILKKCLAMGADEAVLIKDETLETYDGFRTAKILAAAFKNKFTDYDLLLFGKQSVGADNMQIPSMIAELLDLPQVNVVTKLDIKDREGTAHREIEGAVEKVKFTLPAVVSAQKGLNEPRYETLKGIMMAKRKEIPVLTLQDLGIDENELTPQVEMIKLESPPERKAGKVIEGEPEEAAKQIVEFLQKEAKVI